MQPQQTKEKAIISTGTTERGARRRQQQPQQQLIGAIDQGTSSTRFLVFENGTGRLIASSQIEIKRIVPKEGWVEIDPNDIMSSVYNTIDDVARQLSKGTDLANEAQVGLNCIGICNQRESAVVWDAITGKALYNVIVWMDNRTKDLVDDMIDSSPGRNSNWLKDKTGLPMSTYFSAFKLKWLIENVEEVKMALKERRLRFGTVDSWILWNLTGNHLTDVTNASRTYLMDIETLDWDKTLCKHFKIPMNILPKILASADDFGFVQNGPFKGTPVTGVIGDQSAALFGHNCLHIGQTKATFGTGCFIMQNIGPGPLNGALSGVQREAKSGLITTVGYKLRDRPACYALEGSIKIAGAALTWLRDNMQLIQNYEECDQLVNKTTHSAGVFFVPALGGLYSPYWDPNAAGLFIGLSQFTKREHLVRATFDSIAFQTNDIISLMRGVTNGLMIDGGLCKSDNMCQILADITGHDIVRPSMCETSALGAAMVAGCGAGIWSYESMLANSNTSYEYSSMSNQNHHYPHESLHYEDKFSSLIQSKSFIEQSSKASAAANNSDSNSSLNVVETNQKQQQDAQLNSNRSSACNLDDGGGVNDDAGGGKSDDYEDRDEFEEDSDSASIQLVSSDTDYDAGVATSGEFTTTSSGLVLDNNGTEQMPSVITNENALKEADNNNINQIAPKMRYYVAPSSGYSSGDNFELTVVNENGEQLTASGRESVNDNFKPLLENETETELKVHNSVTPQYPYRMSPTCFDENIRQTATQLEDRQNCASTEVVDGGDSFAEDSFDSTTSYDDDNYDQPLSMIERCYKRPTNVNNTNISNNMSPSQSRVGGLMTKPVDVFQSYISLEHRTELVNTWRRAVGRSMQWTKVHHEEIRRIDYQRLATLPISMYMFFSLGTVALSAILSVGGKLIAN